MKKSELKTGMICEDRSEYGQLFCNGFKYILILNVEKDGYYFIRSIDPNHFWFSEMISFTQPMRTSFHQVRSLKLIR